MLHFGPRLLFLDLRSDSPTSFPNRASDGGGHGTCRYSPIRGYVGIILGYAYWRWGLEASIGAHAVLNILVLFAAQIATLVV